MEDSTTESGGGGNGGPTKFLVKTYHMVDDPSTDEIISWNQTNKSFIIKNHTELSRLLRRYFKHDNFSSFIRQLNTYGFRKINYDQWEYANEYFLKDQYHLLGNIHRKETVHRHSLGDSQRLSFEKEIEKLAKENTLIKSNISSFKQHMLATKNHVENLVRRLEGIENRQNKLKNSFEMALQKREKVHIIRLWVKESYQKKRRQ